MNKVQYIKNFGIKLFVIKSFRSLLLKKQSKFAWKINAIKEKNIELYLMKIVKQKEDEIKKIKPEALHHGILKDPIWIMWYQGIENAPDIVKCCIESVKENCSGHEVIVLSEQNLSEFVKLPDFIIEKFKKGYISRTHLSDMIRLNLLYLYGGAWLDATLLTINPIPEEYFAKEIFTINFKKNTKDPSHGRWTTFCFFAKKGNRFIEKILRYHYGYWMKNDYAVDYVMFDYFINYLIKNDHEFELLMDDIPVTNKNVFLLLEKLNMLCEDDKLLTDPNEVFYKLSWKRKFIIEDDDFTLYKSIMKKFYR